MRFFPSIKRQTAFASLRARLRDTHGFTLAEQLVSVVFLGLLCVVIAVGLNAAFQAYRVANESTRANELLTRAVEEVGDELSFASSVQSPASAGTGSEPAESTADSPAPTGTVSDPVFVSPTTKTPVTISSDPNGSGIVLVPQGAAGGSGAGDAATAAIDGGSAGSGSLGGSAGSGSSGTPASSKPALLVASSHGLTVGISNVVFNGEQANNGKPNTWQFDITISRADGSQPGNPTVIASTSMTVAWIG